MNVSPHAGKPAEDAILVNVPRLVTASYTDRPDPAVPAQRVHFGTVRVMRTDEERMIARCVPRAGPRMKRGAQETHE
jgi:hypothetical protein